MGPGDNSRDDCNDRGAFEGVNDLISPDGKGEAVRLLERDDYEHDSGNSTRTGTDIAPGVHIENRAEEQIGGATAHNHVPTNQGVLEDSVAKPGGPCERDLLCGQEAWALWWVRNLSVLSADLRR
jgi:hypothetical protein